MTYARTQIGAGRGDALAMGLAERLHFAVGANAVLSGRPVPEAGADFCRRFGEAIAR